MSATASEDQVVSPVASDADQLAEVLSFFQAHEKLRGAAPSPTYRLSGVTEDDHVELTGQVHAILKQIVAALANGQSVSLLVRDQEITTQQAAEILGLSRPTVVELAEQGEFTSYVPGKVRRKLRLADVLAYREKLRGRRNEFITESSEAYDDADPGEIAELLEEARKAR